MKSVLFQSALYLSALTALLACGGSPKDGGGGGTDSDLESVESKGSEKFNLARFLRENPRTTMLKDSIGQGDAYIFFGDKNKFRLETNMSLDTQGEKGFFMGGPRGIAAAYWLDGYVFGKRIGDSSDRGYLVDLGATGELEVVTMEAHIRFLGQDKYKGDLEGVLDQSFMRDLNIEPVYYPIPLLGLKAGGNIGGELGLRAELGIKTPESMSMIFRPKTSLNAGLSGGIELLKFASAKIQGVISILSIDVASTANLGFMKDTGYSYGHTGVDGSELKALDGKVEILAKAGVQGVLPGGIDAKLWEKVLGAIGIEDTSWEWRHTVWNPTPVFERDLPAYGNSFMKFAQVFDDLADCQEKIGLINARLDQHSALVSKHAEELKGMDAVMAKQSVEYLKEIKGEASIACKQY